MNQLRRKKRGFTLTEIAIVLGIIGSILGAIWVAAAHVSQNQKAVKAQREILGIAQAVRAIYGPRGSIPEVFGTDISPILINFETVFDADMIVGGGVVSPYGGSVAVWPRTTNFRVSFYGVTPGQCDQVASAISQANQAFDIVTAVGGDTIATPATDAAIDAACKKNPPAGGSGSSVEFDFNL